MRQEISKIISGKIPPFLQKYLRMLSEIDKKQIQSRIDSIRSKYNSIISLKRRKKLQKQIDPMLFCFEDLPILGKEYWFMKFTPTRKKDDRQLLAMFGRATEDMMINEKNVFAKRTLGGQLGFMSSWLFDKKKKVVMDDSCSISISCDKIESKEKNSRISFSGKYPKYNLEILKNGRKISKLKISKPKPPGKSYEFKSFFKALTGFASIDLYFDFSGKLNGKNFRGRCYIQKVVIIGPLVPWYWGRIVFSNGSALKYFLSKIEFSGLNYNIVSNFNFCDSTTGKLHNFDGLKVKRIGGKLPSFLVSDGRGKISLIIDTYSSHEFRFKKIGSFNYKEFLGRVRNLKIDGKQINIDNLGKGIGLVEESEGYIL